MAGIYETTGRAKEFSELALNLYDFCPHRCIYCFAPQTLHRTKEDFHRDGKPRVDPNSDAFHADCARHKGDKRAVLLSFACDPYPQMDAETQLTRQVIQALHTYGLHFNILTKAGKLAQRDFDLYQPGDAFATTLTCITVLDSTLWEPNATWPGDRVINLIEAHDRGIETWVSCEPVIDPRWTLELIGATSDFVGHYKIGKMNYHPHGKTIDWQKFAHDVTELLNKLGCRYYIKANLAKYLGKPSGFGSHASGCNPFPKGGTIPSKGGAGC